jgi:two-component system, LytTR family, response regulator
MDTIKVVLADDHEDSIELIQYFLSSLPEFHLVGLCHNGEELIEEVMLKKPDLVLTDINMPKKNGIQAITDCLSFHPQLKFIFITGNSDYAVKAFELAAIDYIVKPVEKDRFITALQKAKSIIYFEQGKMDGALTNQTVEMLPLKDQNCTWFIPMLDIFFIEKVGKKCLVYTKNEAYETNETMGRILNKLDYSFFQAHRSYIINLRMVSKIVPQNETYIVHFKGFNKQASISKLKINEVRERISM